MLIFLLFFLMHTVSPEGSGGSSLNEQYSYNLTVHHLTSRSIHVSWSCKGQRVHDKYEVTLQPIKATYKIVEMVPHNMCDLSMENLVPDTDYKISVASISGRVRRRSNFILFRTPMEDSTEGSSSESDPEEDTGTRTGLKLPNVRLVEVSLVAMALILWAGAIVLFFHRWGKIRMLLPYQPQYKEMKQNGSSTCTNCTLTPHHQCSRLQQLQISGDFGPGISTAAGAMGAGAASIGLVTFTDIGCSPMRPRLNSFVAVSQGKEWGSGGLCTRSLTCDDIARISSVGHTYGDCSSRIWAQASAIHSESSSTSKLDNGSYQDQSSVERNLNVSGWLKRGLR